MLVAVPEKFSGLPAEIGSVQVNVLIAALVTICVVNELAGLAIVLKVYGLFNAPLISQLRRYGARAPPDCASPAVIFQLNCAVPP